MVERLVPGRPGLQPERTSLSWTRTALAAFANGVLLLIRHEMGMPQTLRIAGAGLAFALGIFMIVVSHYRQRTLARRPLPLSLAQPWSILSVAGGTLTFALVALAVIVFEI